MTKKKKIIIGVAIFLALGVIGSFLPEEESIQLSDSSSSISTVEVTEEQETVSTIENEIFEPIILTLGDKGQYGVEATNYEESEIIYFIPSGEYLVKNLDNKRAIQISIYCGNNETKTPKKDDEGYFISDDDNHPVVLMPGEEKVITVPDNRFISFPTGNDGLQIQFSYK